MKNASGFTRRTFLKQSLGVVGAEALALPVALSGAEEKSTAKLLTGFPSPSQLLEAPARAFITHGDEALNKMERNGNEFSLGKAVVSFVRIQDGLAVRVRSPGAELGRVVARWEIVFPESATYLGDHWERAYGDLQWRYLQPERVMPWYFAAHEEEHRRTFLAGVKTQPGAFCFWMVDGEGVSLWMDFRNGGSPSTPGDREIKAATIVAMTAEEGEGPFGAIGRFCGRMCPRPRATTTPICGNNNWYYAYGRDFDADSMRRDAAFLAELSSGHTNRPYCVIDAGWTPGSTCPGGPWTAGDPRRFPDMPGLATEMRKMGVRPGIWVRPAALTKVQDERALRAGPKPSQEKPLDLTIPENLELIRNDIARIRTWEYELIKHDFTTFDYFARWGFEMGAQLTDNGWHLADRSLTNAEILLRLYRIIREAAGDAVVLGCNTVGHLAAGLFEVQRVGDDTSGRNWERTRRMGVNALAYRLPQHGKFFACDADCAAHTSATPWELDRQFLDLIARSGTPLFFSVDPRTVQPEQKVAFRTALQTALSGGAQGRCEPLDFLQSTTPRVWRFGSEETTYRWNEASGVSPFPI